MIILCKINVPFSMNDFSIRSINFQSFAKFSYKFCIGITMKKEQIWYKTHASCVWFKHKPKLSSTLVLIGRPVSSIPAK